MQTSAFLAGWLVAGVLVAGGALCLSGSARASEPLVLDPEGLDRITAGGTALAAIDGTVGPKGELLGEVGSLGGPAVLVANLDAFTQAKADAKGAQASARLFFLQSAHVPPGSTASAVAAVAGVFGQTYASTVPPHLPPI